MFKTGSIYIKKKTTTQEILNNDEDNQKLYEKIVELLIAAGYFRARIASLEPFDKILGGIAWTLTGSFCDVDIEFKDEMNMTEKIKVCEKIVAALKSVNCPILINPVQIHGLDLQPIYQLLQWCVKNLLESRDERNAINKTISRNYFDSKFRVKSTNNIDKKYTETKYNLIHTGRIYRQTKKADMEINDPIKVYFTLVEYGMNKDLSFQRTLIDLLKKKNLIEEKDKQDKQTEKVDTNITNEEKVKLEEVLQNNIEQISKPLVRVNTSAIEEIFSENVDLIAQEIEKFENLKGDESIDRIKLFVKEKERLENNIINLHSQVKEYENELTIMQENVEISNREVTEAQEEIQKLTEIYEDNQEKLEMLENKFKESKISETKMRNIEENLKQKEELKLTISKFKKECLEEKQIYENQLEILERKVEKMSDSDNMQVFEEIDKNYTNEYERLLNKKKELSEQNKIINLLTRKIQVCPSKLELLQYQKRFQELYDQINSISEKSKNMLNDLNSKEEVKKLLHHKLEIFIQLRDSYKNSKSKKDKEVFKKSLSEVLNSINETLLKSSEKLKQLNKSIEETHRNLNELQQYENKYMKLIKEYNKEYNKFNR